jgi:proteasome inhibitor subunit 1 (PI31)
MRCLSLKDGKTLNTESLILEVNKIVKAVRGVTLDDFVADSEALIKKVESELVNPILKKTEKKREGESSSNPLMVQPPRQVIPPYYDGGRGLIRDRDPLRDIGRGDLDPFGRGGGGMIFTPDMPFRPGGFGPLGPLPGMPGAMG